jgi:hypothetical protein
VNQSKLFGSKVGAGPPERPWLLLHIFIGSGLTLKIILFEFTKSTLQDFSY